MLIEIWGDSWGVPPYSSRLKSRKNPTKGFSTEGHLEYRLKNDRHYVLNLAKNAAGNLHSIKHGIIRNASNTWITDCVIWFHTDLGRDIPSEINYQTGPWDPNEKIKEVAIETYSLAKSTLGDTPLIVIEGQNYTLEPYFSDLLPNAHLIPKVVNRLTGVEEIPSTHLLEQVHDKQFLKKINWKRADRIRETEIAMEMLRPRFDSKYFTDNSHPNDKGHLFIYNEVAKILNILQK